MSDVRLRGQLPAMRTPRQVDVLAAFVASGGSVLDAAARVGIRPSTAKRHLADLRARSGLTTEQLIYRGRAEGWLMVPSLESDRSDRPLRTCLRPERVRRVRKAPLIRGFLSEVRLCGVDAEWWDCRCRRARPQERSTDRFENPAPSGHPVTRNSSTGSGMPLRACDPTESKRSPLDEDKARVTAEA